VDDLRESPAIDVVKRLAAAGAHVRVYDPYAPAAEVEGALTAGSLSESLEGAEVLILLVDHRPFRTLDPREAARCMRGRLAFDTRGVWERAAWEGAGFELLTLGVGEGHA